MSKKGGQLIEAKATNPYLAARVAFTERWGPPIERERNWRIAAFTMAIISILSVTGNLYQAATGGVVPIVVEVDKSGRTVSIAHTDVTPAQAAPARLATMRLFVEHLFGVTSDGYLQRQHIDSAYAMLAQASQAYTKMNGYFSEHDPWKRAAEELVEVKVTSVLPTTKRTYQVDWIETTRTAMGELKGARTMRGMFTLSASSQPKTVKALEENPLGMFVTELNWTEVSN